MKKIICLLLCFWLPLFFSAASFASSSMRLAEAIQATGIVSSAPAVQAESAMPEHCPMSMADHADKNENGQDKAPHDKCQHCGFCATLAFFPASIIGEHSVPYHPLSAHIAWASSSYLSPADQRPPISN